MIDLGTLGGTYSSATDINEAGQVVGYSETETGEVHAFIWDAVNGMQDLGTPVSSRETIAINDAGQVMGNSNTRTSGYRAFVWDPVDGVRYLDSFGGGESYAQAINNLGQVTGGATTASGEWRAFICDQENGMRDLGTLGGTESWPYDINDRSEIVGEATTGSGSWHAFVWNELDGMRDLGAPGFRSSAVAINERGEVAGTFLALEIKATNGFLWSDATRMQSIGTHGLQGQEIYINEAGQITGTYLTETRERHPFIWDASLGFRDLGTLGGSRAFAHAINDSGMVVGRSTLEDQRRHPFVWDPANGMQDLGTLGGEVGILAIGSQALALNESGQVVGFTSTAEGETHAFLVNLVIDSDGDGVPDSEDENPNSDTSPTVVIGEEDLGIENVVLPGGTTLADEINEAVLTDEDNVEVVVMLRDFRAEGYITSREMGSVLREMNRKR